jgi:hypothetical protein
LQFFTVTGGFLPPRRQTDTAGRNPPTLIFSQRTHGSVNDKFPQDFVSAKYLANTPPDCTFSYEKAQTGGISRE